MTGLYILIVIFSLLAGVSTVTPTFSLFLIKLVICSINIVNVFNLP